MNRIVLLTCLAVLAPENLRADQCAWNSRGVADKAAEVVRRAGKVVFYCELCDGDVPVLHAVRKVSVLAATMGDERQEGYWEVFINDKAVDLAYVFALSQTPNLYQNLGIAAGCEASGVSRDLTYPRKAIKAQRSSWIGRYERSDQLVSIVLKTQKLHGPRWLNIRYYLISDEWGDNRGELFGYLHLDKDPPTYVTPFPQCHLYFHLRKKEALDVSDNGKCGAAANGLTGRFFRKNK